MSGPTRSCDGGRCGGEESRAVPACGIGPFVIDVGWQPTDAAPDALPSRGAAHAVCCAAALARCRTAAAMDAEAACLPHRRVVGIAGHVTA